MPLHPLVSQDEKELEAAFTTNWTELEHRRQVAYLLTKAQAVKSKMFLTINMIVAVLTFIWLKVTGSCCSSMDSTEEKLNDNEDFHNYALGETSEEAVPFIPIAVGTNPVPAPKKAFQIKVTGRDDYMYQ
ncbi:hypothetical protein HK099_002085 [Clydaea vesicula]|uniref:Transmembrane protein n=1 Tax=Clydaea vesicula TaxID=447962 RepID=A0AAD5U4Q9_9FUNG|nr:hypothetical protein HK099_002085 [Clydaea vesicula]